MFPICSYRDFTVKRQSGLRTALMSSWQRRAGTTRRKTARCAHTIVMTGLSAFVAAYPSKLAAIPARTQDDATLDISRLRNIFFIVLFTRGASRGRFEAEQDAAPARTVRTRCVREAGVSARANYVALPSMAGRGQARTRRKPPDRGVKASVLSRKSAPLAKNRRNGAP